MKFSDITNDIRWRVANTRKNPNARRRGTRVAASVTCVSLELLAALIDAYEEGDPEKIERAKEELERRYNF